MLYNYVYRYMVSCKTAQQNKFLKLRKTDVYFSTSSVHVTENRHSLTDQLLIEATISQQLQAESDSLLLLHLLQPPSCLLPSL